VASGHYVRAEHGPSGTRLQRGLDHAKDQAYFLWGLPRELLTKLTFPLGALTKAEVRARARALGLVTADKPESQEICFVPTGDYRDLLQKRLGRHPALEPGRIVRTTGEVVGEHQGYAGFTVGQRRGLGGGFAEPFYVLEIRPDEREVVVGVHDELRRDEVRVREVNWHASAPEPGTEVHVQLRHRARAVPATLVGVEGTEVTLSLSDPQAAVTPGQSAVFFDGDYLLGGGRIAAASASDRSPRRSPASRAALPR
jgi:tRNA-specific 2-thiouridylase